MTDRIGGSSLRELEAEVPDEWVVSMWPSVRGEVRARRRAARSRWVAPLLAAAVVALLFAQVLTVRELQRVEARSEALAEQLLDQQRRLVEMEGGGAERSRPGLVVPGREAWLRGLGAGAREMTVADFRGLLRTVPASTVLVEGTRSGLPGTRLMPASWRRALDSLDPAGGLTAGDLLDLMDALDLPADAPVPTERIIDMLG